MSRSEPRQKNSQRRAGDSSAEVVLRREMFVLHSISAGKPLHLLVVDLPIIFVLAGTVLLMLAMRWKKRALGSIAH
jgi:hypothetical protein